MKRLGSIFRCAIPAGKFLRGFAEGSAGDPMTMYTNKTAIARMHRKLFGIILSGNDFCLSVICTQIICNM